MKIPLLISLFFLLSLCISQISGNYEEKYSKYDREEFDDNVDTYPPVRPPPVPMRSPNKESDDKESSDMESPEKMKKRDYDYYPKENLGGKYGDGYHDYSKRFRNKIQEKKEQVLREKRRFHEEERKNITKKDGGSISEWNETTKVTKNKRADDGYKLVWTDEFEGNQLDSTKWNYEVNCDGGGNNELQCYTNKESNVQVRDGKLYITARPENLNGKRYTSGRINTKGKVAWKYGKFEARAKLPRGDYLWPALWMMPRDSVYGGWAASGEIDIMESRGQTPTVSESTVHHGSGWPNNVYTGSGPKSFPFDLTADFHTYTLVWERDQMQFFLDDKLYHTQTLLRNFYSGKGTNPYNDIRQPFDKEFFYIINLAIGGGFFGKNANTLTVDMANKWQSPQLVVDYVRIYQKGANVIPIPVPNPNPLPTPTSTTNQTPKPSSSSIVKTSITKQSTSSTSNQIPTSSSSANSNSNSNVNPIPSTSSNQNQNDACKNKCDGQPCCNDQKMGDVCYDAGNYECPFDSVNGKQSLCPKGTGVCNAACFDQKLYCCRDGKIQQVQFQ